MRHALSVDGEDWFQVGAFEKVIDREDWDSLASRVERNTDAVLARFAESGGKATFFTLGWVAQRHPALIRRIGEQGHELASHNGRVAPGRRSTNRRNPARRARGAPRACAC